MFRQSTGTVLPLCAAEAMGFALPGLTFALCTVPNSEWGFFQPVCRVGTRLRSAPQARLSYSCQKPCELLQSFQPAHAEHRAAATTTTKTTTGNVSEGTGAIAPARQQRHARTTILCRDLLSWHDCRLPISDQELSGCIDFIEHITPESWRS